MNSVVGASESPRPTGPQRIYYSEKEQSILKRNKTLEEKNKRFEKELHEILCGFAPATTQAMAETSEGANDIETLVGHSESLFLA